MKKSILFNIFVFSTLLFAEETILLPPITTVFEKSVAENKIIFDSEEIDKFNTQKLTDLFISAGIQILEYGAYGLESKPSIRGFTDETVRVVIDGICVNNAQYGTFDFTSIDVKDIERIEIIKGGFTEGVSDEGSVGGVVYITTKKQTLGHHFSADTSIKSYFNYKKPADTLTTSLNYNGQLGQNSFLQTHLKGTFAHNNYFYKNYRKIIVEQEHSRVMDGNADIKFSQFLRDGSSFTIGNLFYLGDKITPGSKTSFSYGNQKDLNNKLIFNLINPAVLNLFNLENNLAYFKDLRFYTDDSDNSTHHIDTFKYSGQLHFFDWNLNDIFTINENIGISADYVLLNSTNDGKHNQYNITLKSTTKTSIGKHFSFSIPLTIKYCDSNFEFVPKLGVNYSFGKNSIIFDIYKMVQYPNMDDLYWIGSGAKGNPNLKPEQGYGIDLGLISKNSYFPFSISIFSNYYKEKIQWAETNGLWMPQNIASAFYFGIDLDFSKNLLNDRITIKGNGEYLYTRLLDKSNTVTYGNRIMMTPDFTGSLSAAYNFEKGFMQVQLSYMGKRYKGNNNGGFLSPYALVNLSGEYNFWKTLIVYSRIDNLFNVDYESVDNYSMPGISLTLGLKLATP